MLLVVVVVVIVVVVVVVVVVVLPMVVIVVVVVKPCLRPSFEVNRGQVPLRLFRVSRGGSDFRPSSG